MPLPRWSTADFESMSWHDCHVHAIRVTEGQNGSGELELDLDYIVEWIKQPEGITFRLIPAVLQFHEVTDLKVQLDWATPTAALGPFSLDRIERVSIQRAHYTATTWCLHVNWPSGSIAFEAAGFVQEAWGREVVSRNQYLRRSERIDA